jgi:hypothetical protein
MFVSINAAQARKIAGVREVVEIPRGVIVLADSFWFASKAATRLRSKMRALEGGNAPQRGAYRRAPASCA